MRSRTALVAPIAVALLLAACGDEPVVSSPTTSPSAAASPSAPGGPPTTSPVPSATPTLELGPEARAFLALCSVAADIADEEIVTAEATFADEVHETLHELAEDLEGADRALSAGLLQAKSQVEADFAEDPPDVEALTADVAALIAAMDHGLTAVGVEAPDCLEQPT